MLSVTSHAAKAIEDLLATRPSWGMRMSGSPSSEREDTLDITLALVSGPKPTDEVVSRDGARIFIDENVAPVLADKTLDVRGDDDPGDGAFKLRAKQG